VIAINNDDLITYDEVHVAAPFGMDLDEDRRNLDYMYRSRNGGTDRDRELDVAGARYVAAHQHRLSDLGPLLARQRHVSAALALLSLAARRGLALLALLTLRGLTLHLVSLGWAWGLALISLALSGGLILLSALGLTLTLVILHILALGALLALVLRRLACRLVFLATLTLRALLCLALLVFPILGLTRLRSLTILTGLPGRTSRCASGGTLALHGAASLRATGLATTGRLR
jgi:hypothetical protein